jgi:hypothetical protein
LVIGTNVVAMPPPSGCSMGSPGDVIALPAEPQTGKRRYKLEAVKSGARRFVFEAVKERATDSAARVRRVD